MCVCVCRQVSHPPVKASPSLNPPSFLSKPLNDTDSTHSESHSAPSSPTHDQPPVINPRNDVRRSNSPCSRPRSVLVNSELNYSELRFPPPSNSHPIPRARVTKTNYAHVIPQEFPPAPETDTLKEATVNPGHDIEELVDPFSDGSNAAWDDPEAFYDRPPPTRPVVRTTSWGAETEKEGEGERVEEVGEGGKEEGETADTTGDDDCTGGSAYMDTSQFLRTKAPTLYGQPEVDPYSSGDDLPGQAEERDEITTPTGEEDIPRGFGPYDFPTALANFPVAGGRPPGEKSSPGKREGGEDGHDIRAASHAAG